MRIVASLVFLQAFYYRKQPSASTTMRKKKTRQLNTQQNGLLRYGRLS
ncbi:MAG: hypothetical protein ACI814_003294 [Mariniblastus sp.]|jgi:hypothetical protein